jgi:DNA-binding beta-propeller fold protein YncE
VKLYGLNGCKEISLAFTRLFKRRQVDNMEGKITQESQPLVMLFAISVGLLFGFTPLLQAVTMPEYKRLPPITLKLNSPTAVALDSAGNLYVIESSTHRLIIYNSDGRYLKRFSGLDKPISIAVSNDRKIFVGNAGRKNVEVYDTNLSFLFKLGSGDKEFTRPGAIAVDSAGNVYVADSKEDKIKVYNPDGSQKFYFGTSGSAAGQFNFPTSIAINELSEEIIIADLQVIETEFGPTQGARIQVFDLNGKFKRSFGEFGVGERLLAKPMGVAVDEYNRVYVTDAYQNMVKVYDSRGIYLGAIYDLNNPLRTPLGIATSKDTHQLFIASLNTSRVEIYQTDIIDTPLPDIKANNSDKPISLNPSEDLTITISLDSGSRSREEADWWLVVDTPMGFFHYDTYRKTWLSGIAITYQGYLIDLTPTEIINISGLPQGTYTFYFGIDLTMNGLLDRNQLYYDEVTVNIK